MSPGLNAVSQNTSPCLFFFFFWMSGWDTVKYKDAYQHKILSYSIFSLEISASVLAKIPCQSKHSFTSQLEADSNWESLQSCTSFSLGKKNSLCFAEREAVRGGERKAVKVMINQSQHVSSDVTVQCYDPFQWSSANEWRCCSCLQKLTANGSSVSCQQLESSAGYFVLSPTCHTVILTASLAFILSHYSISSWPDFIMWRGDDWWALVQYLRLKCC